MSAEPTDTLRRLAQVVPGLVPVVSVYLNTRAYDEHQRERVRVFLKNESRRAEAMAAGVLEAELAWIRDQGERIVDQQLYPEAEGVALFAGGSPPLRQTFPLAMEVGDSFVVADTPQLRPLIAALARAPRALVVFVDGARARIIALADDGSTDETVLEHSDLVVGHHRRGGWALLLQSRYDKHIRVHRDRHFEAVADALVAMVAPDDTLAIVLAGDPRLRAVFRPHLPPPVTKAIVGEIAGTRWEPAATLAARAREIIRLVTGSERGLDVDALVVEADAGGRATAGVEAVLAAVNRGAVERLYLLESFAEDGAICAACAALQRGGAVACRWCGKPTRAVDLGEALVGRVLSAGGAVESVRAHAGLSRTGGVGALLRYVPAPAAHS